MLQITSPFRIVLHVLRHVQDTLIGGTVTSCIRYFEKEMVKVPCTFRLEYAAFSQKVSVFG